MTNNINSSSDNHVPKARLKLSGINITNNITASHNNRISVTNNINPLPQPNNFYFAENIPKRKSDIKPESRKEGKRKTESELVNKSDKKQRTTEKQPVESAYPYRKPRIGDKYQVDMRSLNEIEVEAEGVLVYSPEKIIIREEEEKYFQRLAQEDAKGAKGFKGSDALVVKEYISQYMDKKSFPTAQSAVDHAIALLNLGKHFEEINDIPTAEFYYELSVELGNKDAEEIINSGRLRKAKQSNKKPAETAGKVQSKKKSQKETYNGQNDLDYGIDNLYGLEGAKIDLKRAKGCFEEAHRFGHKDAYYWMGKYYEEKNAHNSGESKIIKCYTIAAEEGSIEAQYTLGVYYQDLYEKNIDADNNLILAVKFYTRAAKNGHKTAKNNLGTFYEGGIGVDENPELALNYYRLSAKQGLDLGQYNLGICYQEEYVVEEDLEKAKELFELAAAQGHSEAIKALDELNNLK